LNPVHLSPLKKLTGHVKITLTGSIKPASVMNQDAIGMPATKH
jgi:hypothetical protein